MSLVQYNEEEAMKTFFFFFNFLVNCLSYLKVVKLETRHGEPVTL